MYFIRPIFLTTFLLVAILGCQSKLLTVYKIDVQQGNALEFNDVNKITVGMSKEQVQYVLGSPIIVDSFHPDRWDYIYFFIPGYGERERRQLTLFFDRNEVIDIIKQNIVEENLLVESTDADEKGDEKDTDQ